jgi:hypothetical protein
MNAATIPLSAPFIPLLNVVIPVRLRMIPTDVVLPTVMLSKKQSKGTANCNNWGVVVVRITQNNVGLAPPVTESVATSIIAGFGAFSANEQGQFADVSSARGVDVEVVEHPDTQSERDKHRHIAGSGSDSHTRFNARVRACGRDL